MGDHVFMQMFHRMMVMQVLTSIPGAIIAVIVREYTKSLMNKHLATELGQIDDIQPSRFNLLRFVDPLGLILMVVFGYGWGKPTKLNPFAYRDRKKSFLMIFGMAFCANLVIGAAFVVMPIALSLAGVEMGQALGMVFMNVARLNISLAFFNFLPIYPLDGNLLVGAVRPMLGMKIAQYERGLQIGLVLFIVLGGAQMVFGAAFRVIMLALLGAAMA